jgi:hypothetical protein
MEEKSKAFYRMMREQKLVFPENQIRQVKTDSTSQNVTLNVPILRGWEQFCPLSVSCQDALQKWVVKSIR